MATSSLLALGDSYSIGEGVPLYESFPYQVVRLLREAGRSFSAPEILARTGWTTDELAAAMADARFLPAYDFVSLLIGVNNQYRGRDPQEYARQFEELLQEAIRLAGATGRVFVLSIPDWSVTPFARTHLPDAGGRNRVAVAGEIDAFNRMAEEVTRKYSSHFLDITEHTRWSALQLQEQSSGSLSASPSPFAADGLHPSGGEYRCWAEQLATMILAHQ